MEEAISNTTSSASAAPARSTNTRMSSAIERSLSTGDYYDAHQMVKTVFSRLRTRGKTEDAGLVLEDYSFRFIDLQCPELAVDLGCMLVKLYDDCNFACTDERIDAIENLLERCPSNCTPERYRLLNKAIKWAATAEDQSTHDQRRLAHAAPVTSDSTTLAGVNASTAATTAATSTGGSGRSRASVRLHRIAAHIYERDGNFGNAQGHLVFCGDGKALANLLLSWEPKGYPSEQGLFVVRTVLMVLSLEDVDTAAELLKHLQVDFDDAELPAPLQFAYLLVECCLACNWCMYNAVSNKYRLVIRRDPSFAKYIAEIELKIFKKKPTTQTGGIFNLISSLFNNPRQAATTT
eukprot:GHVT01021091.1.p1 GENE.GHVT01021091.1~~GHVT01021091.1.p1  ORF type:complete len:350 (+),score=43.62 GHVT01021091.1:293-1342(+)